MAEPADNIIWHPETISGATSDTLHALRDQSLTGAAYLAGGTALALRFGHRISLDLDFFTSELFDEDALLARLQASPAFSLVAKAPHTIHAVTQGTKVSFLGYPFPLLFPTAQFEGVAVADPRDIACMKLSAIASRGAKRDFIDLYVASQRFGLRQILEWFGRKYAKANYSRLHVLKSLTFFADAEKDPMPHMLVALTWDEVVRFFRRDVPELL
ncbi:MAG: nucleotidyl transferase AbiEii/AbiGii toxin family protein [Acidobacteriota bacterium]